MWANDIDLQDMTCQRNPDARYYGPAADGIEYLGRHWVEKRQDGVNGDWLPNCSSKNWYASSVQLMAFMNAIRYKKIIRNNDLMELLLDTNLMDLSYKPDSTAFSWEPPVDLNKTFSWVPSGNSVDQKVLAKSGGSDWQDGDGKVIASARAYVVRLPYNCDAVLQYNTGYTGMAMARDVVPQAFTDKIK